MLVIEWNGTPRSDLDARVIADMEENGIDLGAPEDLVFHTVFLTDDMDGPTVSVLGGSVFRAMYFEKTEWLP
jgi:hypothetical protein